MVRRPACNSLLLGGAWSGAALRGACNSLLLASAQPAALVVRLEEVLAAGRRHRGRGADLEAQRGSGEDLGEAVDVARAGAIDRNEPVARRRQRCAPAGRAA